MLHHFLIVVSVFYFTGRGSRVRSVSTALMNRMMPVHKNFSRAK
jgi:hypothetical protein